MTGHIYAVEIRTAAGLVLRTVGRVARENRRDGSQSVRYDGEWHHLYEGPNPGTFFIVLGEPQP